MLAELAGDLEQPVVQRQPGHDYVFGDRGFVAEGVAHRCAFRQRGEVEQFDPGRHRLHQADARRRRILRPPMIADQDIRLGRNTRRAQQLLRVDENCALQVWRQLILNPDIGVGGDIAEKQCLHVVLR